MSHCKIEDELIPPICIQTAPLDAEILRCAAKNTHSGAVLVFEGIARDNSMGKQVAELSFSAYEPMAISQLEAIRVEAIEKFSLDVCFIHHRIGVVAPGEAAVVIVCASKHRAESLGATAWLLDELKERVPIWKQEIYASAPPAWVEGKFCVGR